MSGARQLVFVFVGSAGGYLIVQIFRSFVTVPAKAEFDILWFGLEGNRTQAVATKRTKA